MSAATTTDNPVTVELYTTELLTTAQRKDRIRATLEREPWAVGRGEDEKRKAARLAKERNRRARR